MTKLPPEIQEEVYRPGADEVYEAEIDLKERRSEIFGEENVLELEIDMNED